MTNDILQPDRSYSKMYDTASDTTNSDISKSQSGISNVKSTPV